MTAPSHITREEDRRILHLLARVPEHRGTTIEMIEEPIEVCDAVVELRCDGHKPKRVCLAPHDAPGRVFAGVAASPFLKPGDCSVPFQMIVMAVVSGFYMVTFAPLVILAEVLFRRIPRHHLLPIWSIPIFGGCFPVIGLALFPRTWWPEEPADMDARYIATFLALAAFSLAIGAIVIKLRNRKSANTASHGTALPRRP